MGWKDMMDAVRQVIPFPGTTAQELGRAELEACYTAHGNRRYAADLGLPESVALLESPPELRAAITVLAFEDTGTRNHQRAYVAQGLAMRLVQSRLPFTDDQLVRLTRVMARTRREIPGGHVTNALERRGQSGRLPPALTTAIELWVKRLKREGYAAERKVEGRLEALLHPPDARDVPNPFSMGDPWGDGMVAWFDALGPDAQAPWGALLAHASTASGKARPSRRWETRAEPLVESIGSAAYAAALTNWLDSVDLHHDRSVGWKTAFGPDDRNADLLKGLIWCAILVPDEALIAALARFGEKAFKKIPNHGAASTKLGNAVVAVLGAMPDGAGVAQLTRLGTRVRYASARRMVDRALDTASERSGHSREDIEEIAVPAFGLDPNGVKRVPIAGFQAELRLADGKAVLSWVKPNGTPQKTVPKAVKDADPAGLKALRAERKNLDQIATTQARRIELHYRTGRVLPVEALRQRYLEHPVVGQVARRLLWWLEPDHEEPFAALWQDGALADLGGQALTVPSGTTTRLWHPLFGDLERQLIWRDRVDELGLDQPFSQVWREIYRAEDEPGAAVSTRFAGVLLDQRRLYDHAQKRGWRYQIQGHWDSWNAPTLLVPGLEVELEAEPISHAADDSVFAFVMTGSVSFRNGDGQPVALADIAPLTLSELLREVDGLVAASSAGGRAPTTGFPSGFDWEDLAFGPLTPLGRTRRDVLARVLRRTKLRDACSIDDPWLLVRGPRGPARIHIGSGQVQVAGSPEAVVPGRQALNEAKKAFLPFEGDAALPAILAIAYAWHLETD